MQKSELNSKVSECSCPNCESMDCFFKKREGCKCKTCKNTETSRQKEQENRQRSLNLQHLEYLANKINLNKDLIDLILDDANYASNEKSRSKPKRHANTFYNVENVHGKLDNRTDVSKNEKIIGNVKLSESYTAHDSSTAKLSALIMNVPYQEFEESIAKSKPKVVQKSKPSHFDLIERLKDIYKACTCKVCECLVGKSMNTTNVTVCNCKPCECVDCTYYKNYKLPLKSHNSQHPHSGCPCVRCSRTSCKGIAKPTKKGLGECDCNPNEKETNSTNFCNCIPCQCITCKAMSARLGTLVVAPVGENTHNMCDCSPCMCSGCVPSGRPVGDRQMREMSTSVNRHQRCQCESCNNEACIPDDNESCWCARHSKVMSKPVQQPNSLDYDIRTARVGRHPLINQMKNQHGTLTMYAAVNNTYISKKCEKNCDCTPCECIICNVNTDLKKDASVVVQPKQSNVNSRVKVSCKCSTCECQTCENNKKNELMSKNAEPGERCECDTCECLQCVPEHPTKDEVILINKENEYCLKQNSKYKPYDSKTDNDRVNTIPNTEFEEQPSDKSFLNIDRPDIFHHKKNFTPQYSQGSSNCDSIPHCSFNFPKYLGFYLNQDNETLQSTNDQNQTSHGVRKFRNYPKRVNILDYDTSNKSSTISRNRNYSLNSSSYPTTYSSTSRPEDLTLFPETTVETCLNDILQYDFEYNHIKYDSKTLLSDMTTKHPKERTSTFVSVNIEPMQHQSNINCKNLDIFGKGAMSQSLPSRHRNIQKVEKTEKLSDNFAIDKELQRLPIHTSKNSCDFEKDEILKRLLQTCNDKDKNRKIKSERHKSTEICKNIKNSGKIDELQLLQSIDTSKNRNGLKKDKESLQFESVLTSRNKENIGKDESQQFQSIGFTNNIDLEKDKKPQTIESICTSKNRNNFKKDELCHQLNTINTANNGKNVKDQSQIFQFIQFPNILDLKRDEKSLLLESVITSKNKDNLAKSELSQQLNTDHTSSNSYCNEKEESQHIQSMDYLKYIHDIEKSDVSKQFGCVQTYNNRDSIVKVEKSQLFQPIHTFENRYDLIKDDEFNQLLPIQTLNKTDASEIDVSSQIISSKVNINKGSHTSSSSQCHSNSKLLTFSTTQTDNNINKIFNNLPCNINRSLSLETPNRDITYKKISLDDTASQGDKISRKVRKPFDSDYRKIQSTIRKARIFSQQFINLLDMYEKANRQLLGNFQKNSTSTLSMTDDGNLNNFSDTKAVREILEGTDKDETQCDINSIPSSSTDDYTLKEENEIPKSITMIQETSKIDNLLESLDNQIKMCVSKESPVLTDLFLRNYDDILNDNGISNKDLLNTIAEEKSAEMSKNSSQLTKNKLVPKKDKSTSKSFNYMYKRVVKTSKKIKICPKQFNLKKEVSVEVNLSNEIEQNITSMIQNENDKTTVDTSSTHELKETEINENVVKTEDIQDSGEKLKEDNNIVTIKPPKTTESTEIVKTKYDNINNVFTKNIYLQDDINMVKKTVMPLFRNIEMEIKDAICSISLQPANIAANIQNTVRQENKALENLHQEVKKLLQMPLLQVYKKQINNVCLSEDMANYELQKSISVENALTTPIKATEYNFRKVEQDFKYNIDELKVHFLNVRRLSDHTVVIKWVVPKNLKYVEGYELLIDGRAVQKILGPSKSMAIVTCLPQSEILLLTVRTVTHSSCPSGKVPATTVLYRPQKIKYRCLP